MLDQELVERLLAMLKKLASGETIEFPDSGSFLMLDASDLEDREQFKIDVQRKGKYRPKKCTYQKRYQLTEILLRLDIDGPPHSNPDGADVPCPHLHIYREGYAEGWAIPLPAEHFSNPDDLEATLKEFLRYCKVVEIPDVQRRML